jgi:hypothetical protein
MSLKTRKASSSKPSLWQAVMKLVQAASGTGSSWDEEHLIV